MIMGKEAKLVSSTLESVTSLGSVTSSDFVALNRLDGSSKQENIVCDVCNWLGKNKRALKVHNDISHLNVLKFACGKCNYKSYYKMNVSLHKASVHNIEEDKVIRIGCKFCAEGLEHVDCGNISQTKIKTIKKRNYKKSYTKQALETKCNHCQLKMANKGALCEHYQSEHQGERIYKCDNCDFGSNFSYNFERHKKIKHVLKIFQCDRCDFKANQRSMYYQHKEEIHGITKNGDKQMHMKPSEFYCDICDYHDTSQSHLLRHKLVMHNQEEYPIQCDQCNWQGKTKTDLKYHNDISHLNISKFACDKCHYKTYFKHPMRLHITQVHGIYDETVKRIGCNYCENGLEHTKCSNADQKKGRDCKESSNGDQIRTKTKHQRRSISKKPHKGKAVKCNNCDYEAVNSTDGREHYKKEHPGENMFKCDDCEYGSSWLGNIKMHKESMHQNKTYQCDICDFQTKWSPLYFKHQREIHAISQRKSKHSYTTDSKYQCNTCQYSHTSLSSMIEHKTRMHSQLERYLQCDLCGLSFSSEKGLKTHTRLVHIKKIKKRLTMREIKKSGCDDCEYIGTTTGNLNVHVLAKHKGIRFKCDDCEYSATTKPNLKVHVLAKHTDVRFPCKACAYKGTTKRNTVLHMRTVHSL